MRKVQLREPAPLNTPTSRHPQKTETAPLSLPPPHQLPSIQTSATHKPPHKEKTLSVTMSTAGPIAKHKRGGRPSRAHRVTADSDALSPGGFPCLLQPPCRLRKRHTGSPGQRMGVKERARYPTGPDIFSGPTNEAVLVLECTILQKGEGLGHFQDRAESLHVLKRGRG